MRKYIQSFAPFLLLAAGAISLHAQNQTNLPAPPAVPILTNAPPPKPKVVWKSSVAAGLTMTSGNSEATLATMAGGTSRKTDQSEWGLGADGAYGKSKVSGQTETTTTAELLHGFTQYNQLFTDRFYGFGRVEARHDGVAVLKYRISLSAGAGYYFIKNTNTELSVDVGPG